MYQKGFVNILLAAILLALFGGGIYIASNKLITKTLAPTPTPSPSPIPKPIPEILPKKTLTITELKYRLEDELGKAIFCGPPVVSSNYEDELIAQFPSVTENTEEFSFILKNLGIKNDGNWTDQEKLAVAKEHNRLSAITLEETSSDNYFFNIRSRLLQDSNEFIYQGLISSKGKIETTKKENYNLECPICLGYNTLIKTPFGSFPVKDLKIGMLVWTMDKNGQLVKSPVIKTSKVKVPPDHKMIHLVFSDARDLLVSPGHPTVDGRTFNDLASGQEYDGALVIRKDLVSYSHGFTYDILPGGDTGFYWANDILTASTLR